MSTPTRRFVKAGDTSNASGSNMGSMTPPPPTDGEGDPSGIVVNAQYVKDLSFENPNSPHILVGQKELPNLNLNIDVKASRVADDAYEVELITKAEAKVGDKIAFLVELNYAGVFSTKIKDQNGLQPLLLVDCPKLLFPFARAIIANITREGGFPPLSVNPIDFDKLYQEQLARGVNPVVTGA